MTKPTSVENRWDILYSQYPEVYHQFSGYPYSPLPLEVMAQKFDLDGKDLAEIGSGTGRNTLRLSKIARSVVGVEVEAAMLKVAEAEAAKTRVANVSFKLGSADRLPLEDSSVDALLAFTAPLNTNEGLRVVRDDGLLARLDIAPGAYGGDVGQAVDLPAPELATEDAALTRQSYSHFDFVSRQDYKTVDNLVETYGFIFGQKAIDYIRANKLTSIAWTFRVHYLYK